ncbi:protein kinase domain-containing protein [Haliangium sp.]|uniref:serine/threonine-protein kinase n=1 Tax=Haliangium sp. TaxID=2663208 RepID=UPI003D09F87E
MTRYELSERIGAGTVAEIFRGKAVAAGGFEKPVAIKRILPHLSQDSHFVQVLMAEANIVSHLRHRNIVQVFDVGQGPDGLFVVMELVEGCNLGDLQAGLEQARKRLPVELGVFIAAEVCDALEHAHRAPGPDGQPLRLVHRDVAPSNVLLSRSGEVKLTDFGIAKRTEEVTAHGGVRGKFAYISPEQGMGAPVDARSDVFSVGILLFEMVLGRRLFSQLPDFEALRAVCEVTVPAPSEVDPGLDPRLEAIVLKALAAEPDRRYDSAGALGEALREFRYSLPSTAMDPAADLAGLVERLGTKGTLERTKESFLPKAPGLSPEEFSGTSNVITLDDDESLVHKQSYAEALEVFKSEETRLGRTLSGESGPMAAAGATILGMPALEDDALLGLGDGGARTIETPGETPRKPAALRAPPSDFGGNTTEEDGGDVSEEETRVVDPFLRASMAAADGARAPSEPALSPQPMSQRPLGGAGAGAPVPSSTVDGAPVSPAGLASMGAATGPGAAGGLDGIPPETLEMHGEQARAVVAAVEAAVAARQGGAGAAAVAVEPAPGSEAALPPGRVVAAEPLGPDSAVHPAAPVGVRPPSHAAPTTRKPFPVWAVVLFVVLLAGIIAAGVLLGDDEANVVGAVGGDAGAVMTVVPDATSAPPPTIVDAAPPDAAEKRKRRKKKRRSRRDRNK